MRSAPIVTVITPAFNAELYLGEAIRSVLSQKFSDFEYLVIDDGSRDSTSKIAREHAKPDPRVRVISLGRNRGLSHARNAGITAAKGRYIAFLDADDIWRPSFLTETLKVMEKNSGLGAVFTWSQRFNQDKDRRGADRPRAGLYRFGDVFLHICPPGNGSCLLIRKECFSEVGLFLTRFRVGMDAEMWLRIALRSSYGLFYCLPKSLMRRRIHPASMSAEFWDADRESAWTYQLDTYLGELPKKERGIVLRAWLRSALRHGAQDSEWLAYWFLRGRKRYGLDFC